MLTLAAATHLSTAPHGMSTVTCITSEQLFEVSDSEEPGLPELICWPEGTRSGCHSAVAVLLLLFLTGSLDLAEVSISQKTLSQSLASVLLENDSRDF